MNTTFARSLGYIVFAFAVSIALWVLVSIPTAKEAHAAAVNRFCTGSGDPSINPAIETKSQGRTPSGDEPNFDNCSAGGIQMLPPGFALTAVGFGSDDRGCTIYIKQAPVNANGTVDFTAVNTNTYSGYDKTYTCTHQYILGITAQVPGDDDAFHESHTKLSPVGSTPSHVLTGWTWGANTSGGSGRDECFYQEYANLSAPNVRYGWGNDPQDKNGTCDELGYAQSELKYIQADPGYVIVAVALSLADDADVKSTRFTTRLATAAPAAAPTADLRVVRSSDSVIIDPGSANPYVIPHNTPVTLDWVVSNASNGCSIDSSVSGYALGAVGSSNGRQATSALPGNSPGGGNRRYIFTITCIGSSGASVSDSVHIDVQPQPASLDFTVSVTPTTSTDVLLGGSVTYLVEIRNCSSGITSDVSVSVTPATSNVAYTFWRNSVVTTTIPCGQTATLIAQTGASSTPTSRPGALNPVLVTVSGTANGITRTGSGPITMYALPTVQLSANSTTGTLNTNTSTSVTLGWTPQNTVGGTACTTGGSWSTTGNKGSNHANPYTHSLGTLALGYYSYTISCPGALSSSVSSTVAVQVTNSTTRTVSSIDIQPDPYTRIVGQSVDYTVTAYYSDNTTANVTSSSTYTATVNGSKVTVGFGGVPNRVMANTATTSGSPVVIQATYSEAGSPTRTDTANLNINNSNAISCPANVSVARGSSVGLSYTINYAGYPRWDFNTAVGGSGTKPTITPPTSGTMTASGTTFTRSIAVVTTASTSLGVFPVTFTGTPIDGSGNPGPFNFTCTTNVTVTGLSINRIEIIPTSAQIIVGETLNYAVNLYYNGDTNPYDVTAASSFTYTSNPANAITGSGAQATGYVTGSGTAVAQYRDPVSGSLYTSPTSFISVTDFLVACPSSVTVAPNSSGVAPTPTVVNLNFTVTRVNNFSRAVVSNLTSVTDTSLLSPNPRVINLGSGTYNYVVPITMSGKASGSYVFSMDATNVPINTAGYSGYTRQAFNSPCTATINVGNVSSYTVSMGSGAQNVMRYDGKGANSDNLHIVNYNVQLTNCSALPANQYVDLDLPNLTSTGINDVTAAFVPTNRLTCGQSTQLRLTAGTNAGPTIRENPPLLNFRFNARTAGIPDQVPAATGDLYVYGRPRVLNFIGTPASGGAGGSNISVAGGTAANLTWTSEFVPSSGNPCAYSTNYIPIGNRPYQRLAPGESTGNLPASVIPYTYTLACSSSGPFASVQSDPETVTVTANAVAPSAPVVTNTSTACSASISWTVTGGGTITNFQVFRNGNSVGGLLPNTATSFTDPNPISGINTYTVQAIGPGGLSPMSNSVDVNYTPCVPRLDNSNKRVIQVNGVNNDNAILANGDSKDPCLTTQNKLDLKPVVGQTVRFGIIVCNTGTSALDTSTNALEITDSNLVANSGFDRVTKPSAGWSMQWRSGSGVVTNCPASPAWSSASGPGCQYSDSGAGFIARVRNTSLAVNDSWRIDFNGIVSALSPTDPKGPSFFRNRASITYRRPPGSTCPTVTVGGVIYCQTNVSTGWKLFYNGASETPRLIEVSN